MGAEPRAPGLFSSFSSSNITWVSFAQCTASNTVKWEYFDSAHLSHWCATQPDDSGGKATVPAHLKSKLNFTSSHWSLLEGWGSAPGGLGMPPPPSSIAAWGETLWEWKDTELSTRLHWGWSRELEQPLGSPFHLGDHEICEKQKVPHPHIFIEWLLSQVILITLKEPLR